MSQNFSADPEFGLFWMLQAWGVMKFSCPSIRHMVPRWLMGGDGGPGGGQGAAPFLSVRADWHT